MKNKAASEPEVGPVKPAQTGTSIRFSVNKLAAVIALVVVAVGVSLLVQGSFFPVSSPAQYRLPVQQALEGPPEASLLVPSAADSAVVRALEANGIAGALVEVGSTATLVSFNVPVGADARKAAFLALGAAGALSPQGSTVTVEVFEGTLRKTFTVAADDVHALADGRLGEEEFESRVVEA